MDHLRKAIEKSGSGMETTTVRDWMRPLPPGQPGASAPKSIADLSSGAVITPDAALLTSNRLIAVTGEHPPVLDRYRVLRTRMQQALRAKDWSVVGITSSSPEAGKTLTTLNLAITFAHSETRDIVVIDADLRKPSIHTTLGISPVKGLVDYLTGQAELQEILVHPEGLKNLAVIPAMGMAGIGEKSPSELLASERFDALIHALRNSGALVLIDTPPLQVGDDVISIFQRIDCYLLIIEEAKTTEQELQDVVSLLKNFPRIGTVLNKSMTPVKKFQSYYASNSAPAPAGS